MKILPVTWVSQLLIMDEKRTSVTISKQCLDKFESNFNEFLRRYVTVDETWLHFNTPETIE